MQVIILVLAEADSQAQPTEYSLCTYHCCTLRTSGRAQARNSGVLQKLFDEFPLGTIKCFKSPTILHRRLQK